MRGMLLGLAMMVLGGVARGEVVLNNLATGNDSSAIFPVNEWRAVKFSASEGFDGFQTIQLNLFKQGTASGTYSVYLYADGGSNAPASTAIQTLLPTGNINSLGTTPASFITISNFTLASVQNAGSYWIAVQSSGNAVNELFWGYGPSYVSSQRANSSNGSAWTTGAGTATFGAYISTTSVPEPGTLLLGGIAAACGGGGVWWRRKRKDAPVVEEEAPATV